MGDTFYIRPMQPADLDFAAACAAAEGWPSETRAVFEAFLEYDPQGCLAAQAAGQPIGIGIATCYGSEGFVGELIVVPEWRGRGVGQSLLSHALDYLQARGARTVWLDGMVKAVALYERNGFRKVCRSLRFTGRLEGRAHGDIRPLQAADLPAVTELDRRAFHADRRFFIERQAALNPDLCKVAERDGRILGFVLGQRGQGVVTAGPWVALPELKHPERLLESLALAAQAECLRIGVLETNPWAAWLVRSLGLSEVPDPPWRMALGDVTRLGISTMALAIGSPAKG